MISLVTVLPQINVSSVELIKIKCIYDAYSDTALFWVQDETKAVISMLDGNMVIYNRSAQLEELREFIDVLSPSSVFSDADTLTALFGAEFERVYVMGRVAEGKYFPSDKPTSKAVYELLGTDGAELPPYEFFAVDFCHRINHGLAECFIKEGECAAVLFKTGDYALLNGIVSLKKGMGSIALSALMDRVSGKQILCCCRDTVQGFYIKNGFNRLYDAGYWRKRT